MVNVLREEDLPILRSMPIITVLEIHSTEPTPAHLETYRVRLPAHNQAPDSLWLMMRSEDGQEIALKISFTAYKRMIRAGQELLESIKE